MVVVQNPNINFKGLPSSQDGLPKTFNYSASANGIDGNQNGREVWKMDLSL